MSFDRHMTPVLRDRARRYPVVTVTGPRQAGKTTLCRSALADLPYANLERPDTRDFALQDPRGFLGRYASGVILDEVQRVPELLSWIQVEVDERPAPGRFVLTGSHNFELLHSITQSLAGRTALLELLPMSIAELRDADVTADADGLMFAGGYPRIHADHLDPTVTLADYFATYVERDLRQLVALRNLDEFRRFVRLAAGRVGQVLNLHSLANDVGISDPTAREWMSLLEASYVVRLVRPWFANLGKRLIKSPKLYFCDVGLATWLVGITDVGQLATHPLRGHLFENLVVMEFVKHALNQGMPAALHYYRDSSGLEVDLLVEYGVPAGQIGLVEIKSGQTYHGDYATALNRLAAVLAPRIARRMVVYGGDEQYTRDGVEVVGIG